MAHPLLSVTDLQETETMLVLYALIFLNIILVSEVLRIHNIKKSYSIVTNGKHKYSKLILCTYNNE